MEVDEIHVALVGCGGRGSGAVGDAMATSKQGPIKLTAMADAFQDRLSSSYDGLSKALTKQVDVPEERRFIGWDAYKEAMDTLRPGDVVILTTPPAFRNVHFAHTDLSGVALFEESLYHGIRTAEESLAAEGRDFESLNRPG